MNQPFCPNSSKQLRQAPLAPEQEQRANSVPTDLSPSEKTGRESTNMNPMTARPKSNARHKLKAYSNLR